jgi:hypothetical protein
VSIGLWLLGKLSQACGRRVSRYPSKNFREIQAKSLVGMIPAPSFFMKIDLIILSPLIGFLVLQ